MADLSSVEGGDISARNAEDRRPPLLDRNLSEQVADAMFALSTPSRVQILSALIHGPKSVGELTKMLEMEQSAVSHQLRILREHDLVRAAHAGRRRVYDVPSDHLSDLIQAALDHVARLNNGGRRLGRSRRTAGPDAPA